MKARLSVFALCLMAGPAFSESSSVTVVLDDYSGDPPGSLRTLWDSLLFEGIDKGWVGSWQLQSAVLSSPQGTIEWPTAGHVLTVAEDGGYRLDYSPASFQASIAVNGVDMPTTAPSAMLPTGAPGGCLGNGTISGLVVGHLFAPFDVDLDYEDVNGGYPIGAPWMEASIDKAASKKPELHCDGAEVAVASSGVLPALGIGRPAPSANGVVVPYDYEIDMNNTTLTITARDVPGVTYVFTRLN